MTSTAQLKREMETITRALGIADGNKRFSTWGEFNEGYLINLSETEQRQYWHLVLKFALITQDQHNGKETTIHSWTAEYAEELEERVKSLEQHLSRGVP